MKKISLVTIVALAVLLIAAAVPAVSAAWSETVEIDETGSYYATASSSNHGQTGAPRAANSFKITNAENLQNLRALFYRCSTASLNSFPANPQSFTVDYYIGDTLVGNGRYGTYKSTVGANTQNIIWFSFESWDIAGYTGEQDVVCINTDTQGSYPLVYHTYSGAVWAPSALHEVVFGNRIDSQNFLRGSFVTCEVYYDVEFYNEYTISDNDVGWYNIELTREIAGVNHASALYLKAGEELISPGSVMQSENYVIQNIQNTPIDIGIYTATGVWHNRTFLDGAAPDDPAASTVTVYVQNSQTGALIANAHINISANVDNEFHKVINQTLPSGTYTGDLQPTGGGLPNPDFYRLIATAEGYNSIMPYIDFEFDEAVTIYAILDPIGGAPEDENNTFIDFYVRDMSANPISWATVKFGGYTLITNGAGYAIFEVDKNNAYSWTVSKSGYGSLTGNVVIGDDPRHTINTVLAPSVTPTTATPIPTSTSISPTPTMTAPTGEPVSNWLEWFAAHFGMILGGGAEIGKIFMWLCFSVPVGVYVGKESKAGAAGFMAGAGVVTLFFVLIGWVPIWLLVLLVLIIGLLYAKVFNNSDNGGGR